MLGGSPCLGARWAAGPPDQVGPYASLQSEQDATLVQKDQIIVIVGLNAKCDSTSRQAFGLGSRFPLHVGADHEGIGQSFARVEEFVPIPFFGKFHLEIGQGLAGALDGIQNALILKILQYGPNILRLLGSRGIGRGGGSEGRGRGGKRC